MEGKPALQTARHWGSQIYRARVRVRFAFAVRVRVRFAFAV